MGTSRSDRREASSILDRRLGEDRIRDHTLLKDPDRRLKELKEMFDRYKGRYRSVTGREYQLLNLNFWNAAFMPDFRPLNRPATAEDVAAGKAIFHLDGKGQPAALALPARGVLKAEAKKEHPTYLFIVQAETAPDGSVTYGVVSHNGIQSLIVTDLAEIKTFAELEKEMEEARQRQKGKPTRK